MNSMGSWWCFIVYCRERDFWFCGIRSYLVIVVVRVKDVSLDYDVGEGDLVLFIFSKEIN